MLRKIGMRLRSPHTMPMQAQRGGGHVLERLPLKSCMVCCQLKASF